MCVSRGAPISRPPMMVLYLAIGGGIGALARFALGGWVVSWAGGGYPWATFAINVLGSSLLGFFNHSLPGISSDTRAFLTIGLCGGFTTFSTFDYEMLVLLQQEQYLLAVTYSVGSVVACMGGVAGGMWVAAEWMPHREPTS